MKLGPKEIKVVNEYFVRPVKNRLKEIFMKKGLPQLRTADEIKQPPARKDVEDIQAINEFMKRNPRADGGRIGYALGSTDNPVAPQNNLMDMSLEESTTGPGGLPMTAGLTKVLKAPSIIKNLDSTLAGQALNFFKDKAVNAKTANEARKFLNKFFTKEREKNPVLNKISIDKVSKDGSVLYSVKTPDGPLYGKGLDNIIPKRDTYFFNKEKPFRDAGYISTDEAASFLKSKGFSTRKKDVSGKGFTTVKNDQTKKFNPIVKVLGNLTKKYNIDTKQGPGYGGKQIFVKKSDLEDKAGQIVKDYLPKEEKLALAKNLAEEFNTESFSQINKLLKQRGYSAISNVDLNKYFKKFRGVNVRDPDYILSATPTNVIQKIRRDKIKTYGAPNVERVLTSFKKNLGFGQTTELMHPLTKKKATESLYDPEDLMFGSFKENRQYNMGLEGIRNTIQNTLVKIKNNFNSKDLKNNITIDVPNYLRRDFNFPKKMPIKKYIDKLNYMMTDIGLKTNGKIRGALLDDNFKLVENKLGVNYRNVPGMGLIEDNLKSLDPLFKKLKYDRSKGYEAGELLFDDKGMPLIKKGKKLTNEEAETLVSFLGNINKKSLRSASKSQPVSIEEVKEVFKRIPNKKGGPVNIDLLMPVRTPFRFGKLAKLSAKRGLYGSFTPTGLATIFTPDLDLTDPINRISLSAEAAFLPELVKSSIGATKGMKNRKKQKLIQRFLNLGLPTKQALKLARIASPIGIASLAAEGLYQGGKFTKKRIEELRSMTPEQRAELRRQGEAQAFDPFMAAEGGVASGPPPKSGPTPHGLPSLMKRGMKI